MKTIQEVNIGDKVENGKNGKGIVTHKTPRTITVKFENGNTVKNTYRYKDSYFHEGEF